MDYDSLMEEVLRISRENPLSSVNSLKNGGSVMGKLAGSQAYLSDKDLCTSL